MALKIIASNQVENKNNRVNKRQSSEKVAPGEFKITKISQQVKNKQRYSIYINEKYSFSLN